MRWTLFVGFLAFVGCKGAGDDTGTPPDGVCVSGETWTGGDRESPLMHPGVACIECHEARGEGPRFAAAGTVYTEYDEPDDCNGVGAAIVVITDATGTTYEATANAVGNFMVSGGADLFTFPITAKVVVDGVEHSMVSAVTTGDCNSCHTPSGDNGAPGRIVIP